MKKITSIITTIILSAVIMSPANAQENSSLPHVPSSSEIFNGPVPSSSTFSDLMSSATQKEKPYGSITMKQGDMIHTTNGFCTLGYINKTTKRGLIAGHCVSNKESSLMPFTVSQQPSKNVYTVLGTHVGEIIYNDHYNEQDTHNHPNANDKAVIQFHDWVNIASNSYSGDTWVEQEDIKKGDKICSYGARTHKTRCGEVLYNNIYDNLVIVSPGAAGESGDSGGPAWIEGKGFVGIYSYTSKRGNGEVVSGGIVYPEGTQEFLLTNDETITITETFGSSQQLSSVVSGNIYIPIFMVFIGALFSLGLWGNIIHQAQTGTLPS